MFSYVSSRCTNAHTDVNVYAFTHPNKLCGGGHTQPHAHTNTYISNQMRTCVSTPAHAADICACLTKTKHRNMSCTKILLVTSTPVRACSCTNIPKPMHIQQYIHVFCTTVHLPAHIHTYHSQNFSCMGKQSAKRAYTYILRAHMCMLACVHTHAHISFLDALNVQVSPYARAGICMFGPEYQACVRIDTCVRVQTHVCFSEHTA